MIDGGGRRGGGVAVNKYSHIIILAVPTLEAIADGFHNFESEPLPAPSWLDEVPKDEVSVSVKMWRRRERGEKYACMNLLHIRKGASP